MGRGLAERDSQGLLSSGGEHTALAFTTSLLPPSTGCPSVGRGREGRPQDVRVRLESAQRVEAGAAGDTWHREEAAAPLYPPNPQLLLCLFSLCPQSSVQATWTLWW